MAALAVSTANTALASFADIADSREGMGKGPHCWRHGWLPILYQNLQAVHVALLLVAVVIAPLKLLRTCSCIVSKDDRRKSPRRTQRVARCELGRGSCWMGSSRGLMWPQRRHFPTKAFCAPRDEDNEQNVASSNCPCVVVLST